MERDWLGHGIQVAAILVPIVGGAFFLSQHFETLTRENTEKTATVMANIANLQRQVSDIDDRQTKAIRDLDIAHTEAERRLSEQLASALTMLNQTVTDIAVMRGKK